VWMPRRPLLHRPSTVVGNSGISARHFPVLSWIRPLWLQTITSTFRLARRGRCEPPEPHRGVILGAGSGTRFAGRKASGRGSRAAPGDSGLVRSRREADWPVSYQFLRAFSRARTRRHRPRRHQQWRFPNERAWVMPVSDGSGAEPCMLMMHPSLPVTHGAHPSGAANAEAAAPRSAEHGRAPLGSRCDP